MGSVVSWFSFYGGLLSTRPLTDNLIRAAVYIRNTLHVFFRISDPELTSLFRAFLFVSFT